MQWINAHHGNSPIARHAISVLETVGALDLAFDTFVVTLLDGETDTSGYPEYNAIVGGVASHWDEATGDMIVRALAGWGGKGVRGDTDRTAAPHPVGPAHEHPGQPVRHRPDAPRAAGAVPPAAAGWSAPTAASPRSTIARSIAPSAACACCAARSTDHPCPSTTTSARRAVGASR